MGDGLQGFVAGFRSSLMECTHDSAAQGVPSMAGSPLDQMNDTCVAFTSGRCEGIGCRGRAHGMVQFQAQNITQARELAELQIAAMLADATGVDHVQLRVTNVIAVMSNGTTSDQNGDVEGNAEGAAMFYYSAQVEVVAHTPILAELALTNAMYQLGLTNSTMPPDGTATNTTAGSTHDELITQQSSMFSSTAGTHVDLRAITALDVCRANDPCGVHGVCHALDTGFTYTCQCQEGFVGIGCTDPILPCDGWDAQENPQYVSACPTSIPAGGSCPVGCASGFQGTESIFLCPLENIIPFAVPIGLLPACAVPVVDDSNTDLEELESVDDWDTCNEPALVDCNAPHGMCDHGVCVCVDGFTGISCSIPPPDSCQYPEELDCNAPNGVCSNGQCFCTLGFIGQHCEQHLGACAFPTPLDCTGPQGCHGSCVYQKTLSPGVVRICNCTDGYTGGSCEIPPNLCDWPATVDCGSFGNCSGGSCSCDPFWSGTRCTVSDLCEVPRHISCGNGTCGAGRCNCTGGYSGKNCEVLPDLCDYPAPVNCGSYGTCGGGACSCSDGYTGGSCEIPPNLCDWPATVDCGSFGNCSGGSCSCDPFWSGTRCTVSDLCEVPRHISCGNGTCGAGRCNCTGGYSGGNCETAPNMCEYPTHINCGSNGACISGGICNCSNGYSGPDCLSPPDRCSYPKHVSCGVNGICSDGNCFCNLGFAGVSCQLDPCHEERVDCNDFGSCIVIAAEPGIPPVGVCNCTEGHTGPSCSTAPNACDWPEVIDCGSQGVCSSGSCYCNPGYTGSLCLQQRDPCVYNMAINCGDHGRCTSTTSPLSCVCDDEWHGETCEKHACDTVDCGDKGSCEVSGTDAICECTSGYGGEFCQLDPCRTGDVSRVDCGEYGTCVIANSVGVCNCTGGHTGPSCSILPDPCVYPRLVDCGNHGVCFQAECFCSQDYIGQRCEQRIGSCSMTTEGYRERICASITELETRGNLTTYQLNLVPSNSSSKVSMLIYFVTHVTHGH